MQLLLLPMLLLLLPMQLLLLPMLLPLLPMLLLLLPTPLLPLPMLLPLLPMAMLDTTATHTTKFFFSYIRFPFKLQHPCLVSPSSEGCSNGYTPPWCRDNQ